MEKGKEKEKEAWKWSQQSLIAEARYNLRGTLGGLRGGCGVLSINHHTVALLASCWLPKRILSTVPPPPAQSWVPAEFEVIVVVKYPFPPFPSRIFKSLTATVKSLP